MHACACARKTRCNLFPCNAGRVSCAYFVRARAHRLPLLSVCVCVLCRRRRLRWAPHRVRVCVHVHFLGWARTRSRALMAVPAGRCHIVYLCCSLPDRPTDSQRHRQQHRQHQISSAAALKVVITVRLITTFG